VQLSHKGGGADLSMTDGKIPTLWPPMADLLSPGAVSNTLACIADLLWGALRCGDGRVEVMFNARQRIDCCRRTHVVPASGEITCLGERQYFALPGAE